MYEILIETLEDIILYAYENENKEIIKKYLNFTLRFEKKQLTSKSGDCSRDGTIRIFNLTRSKQCLWVTILHEVAHHIDIQQRGTSDHGKYFYDQFQKLLWTALNMKILDKNKLMNSLDYSLNKKTDGILQAWIPEYINYSATKKQICLKNADNFRKELYEGGYDFNSQTKKWEWICDEDTFLQELEVLQYTFPDDDIEVKDIDGTDIDVFCSICVSGFTYNDKEKLKELHYMFDNINKRWHKLIIANTFFDEREKLLTMCDNIKNEQIAIIYY